MAPVLGILGLFLWSLESLEDPEGLGKTSLARKHLLLLRSMQIMDADDLKVPYLIGTCIRYLQLRSLIYFLKRQSCFFVRLQKRSAKKNGKNSTFFRNLKDFIKEPDPHVGLLVCNLKLLKLGRRFCSAFTF